VGNLGGWVCFGSRARGGSPLRCELRRILGLPDPPEADVRCAPNWLCLALFLALGGVCVSLCRTRGYGSVLARRIGFFGGNWLCLALLCLV